MSDEICLQSDYDLRAEAQQLFSLLLLATKWQFISYKNYSLLSKALLRQFIFEEVCTRAMVFVCSSRHSKFGLGLLARELHTLHWLSPYRKAFPEWRRKLSPWFYCSSVMRTAHEGESHGRLWEHDIHQHLLSTSSGEGWSFTKALFCLTTFSCEVGLLAPTPISRRRELSPRRQEGLKVTQLVSDGSQIQTRHMRRIYRPSRDVLSQVSQSLQRLPELHGPPRVKFSHSSFEFS